jgi:Domain of unknown function (DUF4837)
MKKIFFIASFLLAIFLISACDSSDKPARGYEDEIFVVADSVEYEQLKPALESIFEKKIYTPQPENIFTLNRISTGEIDRFKRKKNIIIIAPLNSGSHTSEYIKATVDSAIEEKFKNESDFILFKKDFWAKDQLLSIISASSMQDLISKLNKNSENLLYTFQKTSDERLFNSLYNPHYEQKNIEGKFLKDYGWVIYVQADFKVALNNPEDNFIWLRRSPNSDMERWIFIHWIDNATPEYLNVDSIRAIRNRVTKKFYQGTDDTSFVVIAQDYFTTNEINFHDRYAIFTQGLWEMNIKGMGGPFVNYYFYDEATHRIYMIDGSLYAPKFYKRNLIQQMDVTLQSFRTESELSKDRKQELLDAVE